MRNVHTELPATDFAITSVNVPDRLDLREVHDRSRHDEDSRRSRLPAGLAREWLRRGLVLAVLLGLVLLGLRGFDVWRNGLSAASLSQEISSASGVAVTIGGSSIMLTPSPRLVLSSVQIKGGLRFDEVAFALSWADLTRIVRGGEARWGDLVVAPTTMSLEQAQSLIKLLPQVGGALPASVAAVRFERVTVSDFPWASGPFSAVASRESDGSMGSIGVKQVSGDGVMKLQLTAVPNSDDIRLQCDAQNWVFPFLPKVTWSEVVALGRVSPTQFEIPQFSLGSAFGVIQGRVAGSKTEDWTVSGTAHTNSLDIESMLAQISPKPTEGGEKAEEHGVLQGTATFDASFLGLGPTIANAVEHVIFDAPVQIRWGALNGVNLGYAATRPTSAGGTSGGSTRFTELDVSVHAADGSLTLRNIHGRAGAMSTRGELAIGPDMQVSGVLHVDLGATRVQAPIRVHVRGNALHPIFGRQ